MPKRPCLAAGCRELVERGYCPGHEKARNRRHNNSPARAIYHDPRWRGRNGTRARALRRAGYQCEVVENGERCTVRDRARLHGAHWPRSVAELVRDGDSPFDERYVRIACDSHHARLDRLRRASA